LLVGSEPKWLLLGIMSATGFLSIWISNTATASMIYPIVISIVQQLVILNPEFQTDADGNQVQDEGFFSFGLTFFIKNVFLICLKLKYQQLK
jgi:di/tricarboxylate transporter